LPNDSAKYNKKTKQAKQGVLLVFLKQDRVLDLPHEAYPNREELRQNAAEAQMAKGVESALGTAREVEVEEIVMEGVGEVEVEVGVEEEEDVEELVRQKTWIKIYKVTCWETLKKAKICWTMTLKIT